MKYKEVTIYTEPDLLRTAAEELSALGYEELMINDPSDVEELAEESWGFTGSFVDNALIEELRSKAYIVLYLGEKDMVPEKLAAFLKRFDHRIAIADDQDWLHKWEEYFMPFEIAGGVVIKPVWREYSAKDGETVIEIDPGLAFGTGSSPTTCLAARLLKEYMEPGDLVIDVGCGTGIQSLIASKLGAGRVLAMDYDPEAVASTRANVSLNGCTNIEVMQNDLVCGIEEKADIIVANLTVPLITRLLEGIGACCRRGTIFISSGIIDDAEASCAEMISSAGFEIKKIIRSDCWSAVAAARL